MMRNLTLFDLMTIRDKYLPAVAFTYDPDDLFSRIIRRRTDGYAHAMWLHKPGRCASQGWTFREKSIREYEKSIIEVWHFPTWSERDRDRYQEEIQQQIDRSGFYDLLGIFGQAVRIPIINIPFLDYCSERVYRPFMVIDHLPRRHPSPAQLHAMMPKLQGDVYGVYDPFEDNE